MRSDHLAVIINFCSNESNFITACIQEIQKVTKNIIVPVSDHFFDGTDENHEKLESIFASFPGVTFILYPFMPSLFPEKDKDHHLHNASRAIGMQYLPDSAQYVLFLDADEVVDGERFRSWLNEKRYLDFEFIKLSCYWYFREPCNQATTFEASPLLVKRSKLNKRLLMHHDERNGIYSEGRGKKIEGTLGVNSEPMFHHYSWVRSKEEMIKKTETWSHRKDRNWSLLIKKEFEGPFSGKDFVHGYEYKTVKPFSDLKEKFSNSGRSSVKRLDIQEMIRLFKESPLSHVNKFIKSLFKRSKKLAKKPHFRG